MKDFFLESFGPEMWVHTIQSKIRYLFLSLHNNEKLHLHVTHRKLMSIEEKPEKINISHVDIVYTLYFLEILHSQHCRYMFYIRFSVSS